MLSAARTIVTMDDATAKEKLARMAKMDEAMHAVSLASQQLRGRFEREREVMRIKEQTVRNTWREVMRLAKVSAGTALRGGCNVCCSACRVVVGPTSSHRCASSPRHCALQTEELRSLLGTVSAEFDRSLESKEALLQRALDDLAADEDHQRHVTRAHSLALHKLLELQERRTEDVRKAMVKEVRELKEAFEVERAEIMTKHAQLRTELLHVIRAVKDDEEKKAATMEADFAQSRETLRRRALERIHTLQTDMDSAIEVLEKAFEDAHARYLSSTDQRTQDFKALSARGQHDTQLKERQRRAIKRLQEHLQFQQNRLAYLIREEDEKNKRLQEERDSIAAQLSELKARMAMMQDRALSKMKQLSTAVTETSTTLQSNLDLAARILSLASAARTLEPQSMKNAPFLFSQGPLLPSPHESVTDGAVEAGASTSGGAAATATAVGGAGTGSYDAPPHVATIAASTSRGTVRLEERSTVEEMAEEPELLANFYDRYNAALLQQLALEERHKQLAAENKELRAALSGCITNTTVAEDTLDKPNTLMVINGRTSRLPAAAGGATLPAHGDATLKGASVASAGRPGHFTDVSLAFKQSQTVAATGRGARAVVPAGPVIVTVASRH